MPSIQIESSVTPFTIILKGNIEQLLNNRRSLRTLKDCFETSYNSEEVILKYSEHMDISEVISLIIKICSKVDIDIEYSSNVSTAIKNFESEENKFSEFAEKARTIRNNECNKYEFQEFETVVAKKLKNRQLYPMQLLSAYHLAFSQNACNFSVPGAGKTSIVYGAYSYLSNLPYNDKKHVDKILVISPLSAFGPWKDEFKDCFGVEPTCQILSSNMSLSDKRIYLYSQEPAELTLISYYGVHPLLEDIKHYLSTHHVMVVLDEAHKIKNTDGGIIASSVLELSKYSTSRIVLTGTPAPNGYEDLLNIYKFIWPSHKIIPYQLNQLKDISKHQNDPRATRLISSIEPFFISIKKSDLKLPEAIEHTPIVVPMGDIQRKIYDTIERQFMNNASSNTDISFLRDLNKAKLIRLMQVATNPNLLNTPLDKFSELGNINANDQIDDSTFISDIKNYSTNEIPAKFEVAKNLINEIISNNQKVIVWATFIQNIIELQKFLEMNGIKCKTLYGATPISADDDNSYSEIETRESIIKEFHNPNSDFKVIIANPFAVSESISLHKACHNAIYIERSFNAAHFIQSKNRIHRYGLDNNIVTNYYYLVSENSIDHVIDDRLKIKEKRLQEILENMPIPLFSNIELDSGDEDIKALIKDYVERTKTRN